MWVELEGDKSVAIPDEDAVNLVYEVGSQLAFWGPSFTARSSWLESIAAPVSCFKPSRGVALEWS